MAAPLRSANPQLAKSMQFTHFGVLDTGGQSKTSTVTSLVVNCVAARELLILSAAAKRETRQCNRKITQLIIPIAKKEPELHKPTILRTTLVTHHKPRA